MKELLKNIADFFRKLRRKPEGVRQAWFAVFVLGTILVVLLPLWLIGIYSDINQDKVANDDVSVEKSLDDGESWVDIFKTGAKKVGQDILKGWEKAGEGVSWFFSQVYNLLFKGVKGLIEMF